MDKKALELARALEREGNSDSAFHIYVEQGAVDDAARLLSAQRKFAEAGKLLLRSLGVEADQVGQLESAQKKRALMAAICFSKAGENQLAIQLFVALGEQSRAVELLAKTDPVAAARLAGPQQGAPAPVSLAPVKGVGGASVSLATAQRLEEQGKREQALEVYVQLKKFGEAARLARALGRLEDAASLFAEAGMAYEAASCYHKLGDTGKCLDNLVRVPRDDRRYRNACGLAIKLSSELGVVSLALEQFVGTYLASGPQDDKELEAFYLLGKLYRQHDLVDNAREVLAQVVERNPGFRDAAQVLAALRREESLPRGQMASTGETASLTLPELPDLDGATRPHLPATLLDRAPTTTPSAPLAGPGAARPASTTPAGGVQFTPGGTVAERYKIEEQIGKGGMATVYRAHDLELGEEIALKVFEAQGNEDEVQVARFKLELKLSRQLNHPNIIRLYDIGMFEKHRYISMELLRGQSLKTRLKEPIHLLESLQYLVQICAGLQAAHEQGVIHRDVKPDNFFLTESGQVKVMDFGIAKLRSSAPSVTMTGTVGGTPAYMSPEQITAFSEVTTLADLYSLGVVAYEMFTGQVPFKHAELVPLLMLHLHTPPEPPRTLNPELPIELEAIVLRLLQKDPARRFQSCRELQGLLEEVRRGLSSGG